MKKKVALLTGGSSGIGKAIKDMLLKQNYTVYALVRKDQEPLANSHSLVCDLNDTPKLEALVKDLLKDEEIDLLINSAGVGKFEPHEELSLSQIKNIIDTNLTSPLILTSLCLRSLKKTRGKVINISSIEALKTSKFSAVYSASKAGLHHFGNALFEEVRKAGVNIITIHPDMTQTPFFDDLHFEPKAEVGMHLLPEDIAQSIEDILKMREGVSITEVTIRPQYFGIKKK